MKALKYLICVNAKRFLTFSPPDVDLEKNTKSLKINNTWVALDRVRDPGNLGTIIRTCDAVVAEGVILIGNC